MTPTPTSCDGNRPAVPEIVIERGISNRDFLERHALAGRVGLSTGVSLVDRAITRAERHLDAEGRWGGWSHAFIFEGPRADGQHWVIESDLQFHRRHYRLGVQENRIAKYGNEEVYTGLAVLDFGLTAEQTRALLTEALELVAAHTRYSIRELWGTLVALHQPHLRAQENLLARDNSFFCSAFVLHLFRRAGLDLTPGLDVKNATPEDLIRSVVPHRTWLLVREAPHSRIAAAARRVTRKVKVGVRFVRRQLKSSRPDVATS